MHLLIRSKIFFLICNKNGMLMMALPIPWHWTDTDLMKTGKHFDNSDNGNWVHIDDYF